MKNIFLLIKGLLASLFQGKVQEPSGLREHTYFCYYSKGEMGVALQQPSLCSIQTYTVPSREGTEVERFLESLYTFLNGVTQLNFFKDRKITVVVPYYHYWLILMNLDHWQQHSDKSRRLIQGIAKIMTMLVQTGNFVTVKGSWPGKPGLKAAQEAVKDNYRLE
jgi:hypothetical protein